MLTLELKPAYCRKYISEKQFKNDFNNGKDFYTELREYFSIRNINALKDNFQTAYFMSNKPIYIIRFGEIQEWVNTGKTSI